ncbi:ERMES complex subunit [Sorochytrium milnesiophthora]
MAFHTQWPHFSQSFIDGAKAALTQALNRGEKPANILGLITVTDLHMGSVAPELEVLEIGEIGQEKLRGMFKLTYAGDAFIVLQTKVQVNPLTQGEQLSIASHQPYVAASAPLIVPLQLRISNVRLRGLATLAVDKNKGVTLAFKNDPLEHVDVNSTFDHMSNIRKFLQTEIEKQLRSLFQETIPALVHAASVGSSPNAQHSQPKASSTPSAAATMSDESDAEGNSLLMSQQDQQHRWLGNESDESSTSNMTRDDLQRISQAISSRHSRSTPVNASPFNLFRRGNLPTAPKEGLLKVLEISSSDEERRDVPPGSPTPTHTSMQSMASAASTTTSRRTFVTRFNTRNHASRAASLPGSPAHGFVQRTPSTTSLPTFANHHVSSPMQKSPTPPSSLSVLPANAPLNNPTAPSSASSRLLMARKARAVTPPPPAASSQWQQRPELRHSMSSTELQTQNQSSPRSRNNSARGRSRRSNSANSRSHSRRSSDAFSNGDEGVTVQQDNLMAARLANMFNANQSLSPFSRTHEHSTFRTSIPVAPNSRVSASMMAAAASHMNSTTSLIGNTHGGSSTSLYSAAPQLVRSSVQDLADGRGRIATYTVAAGRSAPAPASTAAALSASAAIAAAVSAATEAAVHAAPGGDQRSDRSGPATVRSDPGTGGHVSGSARALSPTYAYDLAALDPHLPTPGTAQRPQRPIGYFVHHDGDRAHYHIVHYNRLGKRGKQAVRKRVFWVDLRKDKPPAADTDQLYGYDADTPPYDGSEEGYRHTDDLLPRRGAAAHGEGLTSTDVSEWESIPRQAPIRFKVGDSESEVDPKWRRS